MRRKKQERCCCVGQWFRGRIDQSGWENADVDAVDTPSHAEIAEISFGEKSNFFCKRDRILKIEVCLNSSLTGKLRKRHCTALDVGSQYIGL